jgi:hypothetical protein
MIAESCPKLLTIGGNSFNDFLKKMILSVGWFSLCQRRNRWVRIEYIGPLDRRFSKIKRITKPTYPEFSSPS